MMLHFINEEWIQAMFNVRNQETVKTAALND